MGAKPLLPVLLGLALAACTLPRAPAGPLLQDGDCASVPEIDRLTVTVSDHGTKVAFRWGGTGFAGMVLTGAGAVARDASYGANQPGEWERRFPDVPATTTVPGAFLGFPAMSNPRAGVLAATVYDEQYPAAQSVGRALVVVDLKARGTQLLGAQKRVQNVAVSPNGEYVAVVEVAPASRVPGFAELFGFSAGPSVPRYDLHATVYSTTGLVACSRRLAGGLPTTSANLAWE